MNAHERLASESFPEYAFLRWVLGPAVSPGLHELVTPQREVEVAGRRYRVDYEIAGSEKTVVAELDGFAFHGDRDAFSYDRLRQNDLQASGRLVLRFSYDSVRAETARCAEQLAAVLRGDPLLAGFVVDEPLVERPDMEPDPLYSQKSQAVGAHPCQNFSAGPSVRERLCNDALRSIGTDAGLILRSRLRFTTSAGELNPVTRGCRKVGRKPRGSVEVSELAPSAETAPQSVGRAGRPKVPTTRRRDR